MDRVKALKYESGEHGTQEDVFPTETNPTEDYLACKGVAFENSELHYIDTVSNELRFRDPVNGIVMLSQLGGGAGLSESAHDDVDQLVHEIRENSYMEITRVSGRVSTVIWYADINKTMVLREFEVQRDGNGGVIGCVLKQRNDTGSICQTYTQTLTRVDGRVTAISGVLT